MRAFSRLSLSLALVMTIVAAPALARDRAAEDKEIAELRRMILEQQKTIDELRQRLEKLEQGRGAQTEEPEIPRAEVPADTLATKSTVPASTFMPDLAVIGNHRGVFLVPRGYEGRNRFQLGELELALQQPIYTGMKFYATLAGGADAGFNLGVEEGYVTLSRPFKLPFDATAGKRRLQFGKINALHPHQWRYADAPAAAAAFLGEEGLFGNGASLNYTLPTANLFANLEIGFWGHSHAHALSHAHDETSNGEDEHPELGPQIASDMAVARLWLSRAIGVASELELGVSHAWAKGDIGDPIRLGGVDLTYRGFPSTFSRLQLQGELFWHRRKERTRDMWHTRSGHYVSLSYAPDKYSEYGLRLDNTRFPWPLDGREQSVSLVLTNRLSEATLIRLQYKLGDRTADWLGPARKGSSEVLLQFVWGAGSHTHPLQ